MIVGCLDPVYESDRKGAFRRFRVYLARDLLDELGFIPPKTSDLKDVYSKSLGLTFSILEEKHEIYWLLVEELE